MLGNGEVRAESESRYARVTLDGKASVTKSDSRLVVGLAFFRCKKVTAVVGAQID